MKDKTYFAVITPTLCQGNIMAWNDDNENPILFTNAESAWKEIAEDIIHCLQQFIKGDRDFEDTEFGTNDYVVEVKIVGNMVVPVNEGECEPREFTGDPANLSID